MSLKYYLFSGLMVFLCSLQTFGQQKVLKGEQARNKIKQAQEIVVDETSTPRFIKFRPEITQDSVPNLKALLNLSASEELKFSSRRVDQKGVGHTRYKQTFQGVEVFGAEYIVHTRGNRMLSANGNIVRDLNVRTTPVLSEQEALQVALDHIGAQSYMWENENQERFLKQESKDPNSTYYPKGKLLISSPGYHKGSNKELVYQFNIYAESPLGRYNIEVDAITGEVMNFYNKLHHVTQPGTGVSMYDGTVDILVDFNGSEYSLSEETRGIHTYDLLNGTNYGSAVSMTDPDNHFETTRNQAGVSAHFGAEVTYDYFLDNFGRNSYDDSGADINSYVHYSTNYFNAFWDGFRMTYGDGDGVRASALVSLDIVGHEITHAVTEHSAGLVYSYESGALNESFSDIFGQSIEFVNFPETASWNLADQIYFDGVSMIRSMSNPNSQGQPDTYLGDLWFTGSADNGGVHYNSGVQNYWYYLLVEGGSGTNDFGYNFNVSSIGLEAAQQIAYRNLTIYLTPISGYNDARVGAEQSAIDLFGFGSFEHLAVVEAWNAVGVPAAEPMLVVSGSTNFGNTPIGFEATLKLQFSNIGTGLLVINDINSNNDVFVAEDTSFSIPESTSRNLNISFSPSAVGDTSAYFTIFANTDTTSIFLSGSGVLPPVMTVSPSLITETLNTGDLAEHYVTIDNSAGESDLSFSIDIKTSTSSPISAINLDQIVPIASKSKPHHYLSDVSQSAEDYHYGKPVGPVQGKLFATNSASNTIIQFDPSDGTVINSFASPDNIDGPDGLAYDGDYLYQISTFGTSRIFRLGPEDGAVLDSISIPGLGSVDGLGHSGQNLYATNYSLGVIYKIDFDAAIVTEVIDLGLPFGGGISYGGTRNTVFVADFNVIYEIDPETSTLISQSSGFGTIYGLGYSEELSLLFIADVGTGQIRALNPDTWETVYSFTAPNLTSLAADENSFTKWLTTEIESGEIPPGESLNIPFQLNASNLFGGDYHANIFIHGNDPANTMDSISVELTVNGVPIVNLDQDTLIFQDTFIGGADTEILEIENAGTDKLNVQLVFEDDIFSSDSTSFSLAPLKSASLDIFFQPVTSVDYNRELLVVTNDESNDTIRIRLLGTGLEPPVISVLPDSIGVDLFTGDSISQSITIGNTDGGNPLIWEAEIKYKLEETALYGLNKHSIQYQMDKSSANQGMGKIGPLDMTTLNSLDGSTEILAWIGFADFSREYPNTLNAISQYYTNFSVDTTSATNPIGLSDLLADKDVFLIPEQESGSVSFFQSMGSSWALVLEDFVSRGGAIILCGSAYGAHEILNTSGLMSMSQGINLNTYVMTVEDTLHRITAGLPGYIVGQNATFGMNIQDESEQLVTYNGYAAVAYKEVGRGFITYLGYDYYNYDDHAARMIANAVSYGGAMNGWLNLEIDADTLAVGETQTFDAEMNAKGLFGGLYQADIIISNNDPLNPEIIIPVSMDVTGVPMINVETDSLDFGYTYTGYQDSMFLSIVNEGTDVLEISLFFADEEFLSAEGEITIPAQEYYELKVFFDPDVAGILQSDLLVISNDSNNDSVYVVLTGHAIDPPVMVIEPDSLDEELFSGSTSTQYITIDNSAGGSDLIWDADFSLDLEESSLYVKHSASIGSEESYVEGDQGLARVAPISMVVINNLGGSKNILALTTYADFSREYPNTLNAIAQYYTDFNTVTTNTTDPFELDSLLDVSDIFLIPEQEGGSTSYFQSLGVSWADVLHDFLSRGGSIIICGSDNGSEEIVDSGGLMSIGSLGGFSSGTLIVEDQTHFITEGLPGSISALNATFSATMPESASEHLVTYAGDVVVGTKPYGKGQINYIGFDYYNYDDAAARLIANTVANTGRNLQWLSLENTSDTIPAGSSSELIVSFDASGQYAGGYDATISIASNDPAQSVFNVPVHLDVIGAPNILLVQDTLIFNDTYVGYGDSLMLEIVNDGTDSLFLTIIPQNPGFSTGYDSLYILPGESEGVNVFFHPADPISYDTHLLIISNDPDDDSLYVNLIGQGVAPPVISITPDSVSDAVFSNDSTIQSLTIDNTLGGSVLNYSITLLEKGTFESGIIHHQAFEGEVLVETPKVEPILIEKKTYSPDWERNPHSTISGNSVELEDVKTSLDSGFWEISSLIPSRYNFSGGETGTGISDGGNDMYDGGNYLSTNFGGSIEYTNGSLQSSPYLANKDYFTAKYPGLFVLAAEISEIDFFTINGNLGADGGGSVDESVLQVSKGGRRFLGFVKRVYNAGDPSVNHLIIVEDNDIVNHEITTNTNDDYHQVNNLEGIDRLYYLLYAGSSGLYIDDSTALVIMNQFLDVINEGDNWLSLNKYEGSIQAGETEDLDLTFNASGLYGGLYEKDLLVQSNDPANNDIIVPVSLTVIGAPDIVASTETIDFGNRYTGSVTTKTFTVSNEGTDTLFVSDIVNANAFIDVDITDFELAPEEAIEIAVTYSPALEDSLITHLFIESNDPNQSSLQITLVGNAIDPPVMSTSPDSVGVSLYTGQQTTETITIDNTSGGSILEVTVEFDYLNRIAPEVQFVSSDISSSITGAATIISGINQVGTGIGDSLNIAIYGQGYGVRSLLESFGYRVEIVSDADIQEGDLDNFEVLVMMRRQTLAPPDGIEEKILNFLSQDKLLITEWSSSSLLFSEVGPNPYYVVTPQWEWFEGTVGHGFDVARDNPIYHTDTSHPVLFELPDPFSADDGTQFFFTLSGYNTLDLHEIANYNGHGGNWPAIVSGEYGGGQVLMLFFDAADNPEGTQQLWYNAVNLAKINPDWVSIESSTLSIPAGAKMETELNFNAYSLAEGPYRTNLKVYSNDPANSEVIIPIAMDVIAASDIELDVEELGFGDVLVGASISRSIIVHNYGSAPLNLESIYSDRADFLVTHFPSAIEPGGQGIVQLEFRPISSGHIPGVLTIESNDIDEGSISIDLYGTGVPPPVIEVTPVTISEHLIRGESVTRELVISNEAGNSPLFYHFSDTNISWLTFSPASDSVDAGGQSLVDMYISTDQLEIGHYTVPIKISSNDPNTPTVEVPLHLRVSGIPDIGISVSSISFGEVIVGDTALAVVEITNTGPDTLKINDITITDNQFLSGLGSNEIPPYDTTTLTLSFAPQMSGLIMSEISIVSNDPNESVLSIQVQGEGVIINVAPIVHDQEFEVPENSPAGYIIGKVEALDPNGDNVTFSLTDESSVGTLEITETGEIVVSNPEALDFESNSHFVFTVVVSDGQLQDSALVSITVLDVNERPSIYDQSFEVNENSPDGFQIGSVIGDDLDGDLLSFSIVSGNTQDAVTLNSQGILSINDSSFFNFETHHTLSLVVEVSDGALKDSANMTIIILDVEEPVNHAPVILDQIFTVKENADSGHEIGQVIASDEDDDELSFYIISGNDFGTFGLDPTTGILTLTNPEGSDFIANSTISFIVEVSDGEASDLAIVNIAIAEEEVVLSVDENTLTLKVYPNPTSGFINISGEEMIKSVELIGGSGQRLMFSVGINSHNHRLDVKTMPAGVYYLVVEDQAGKNIKRVIIE